MDEPQTITTEQIWEDMKPYLIAGLKQKSAFFREGCPPEQTMRWAYVIINNMSLSEARAARGQQ